MRTPLRRFRATATSSASWISSQPSEGRSSASTAAPVKPEEPRRFRWIRGRRYLEGTTLIGPKDAAGDQFLDFQHFIVRRVLGGNHQAPLTAPRRILDAGCGTGRWVVEMAAEFPGAEVIGLDLVKPNNLAPMLTPLGTLADHVSFVEADLRRPLSFPDDSFDYTHMYLLYDDLPPDVYLGALRELVRVTRPGGWVECAEPGEAIYQSGPAYQLISRWVAALCRRRGLNPDLGPRVKELLQLAGVPQVTERVAVCFSDLAMTRERRFWQAQAVGAYETIFREPVLEAGLATTEEYDRALEGVRAEFESGRYANSDVLYVAYGQVGY